MKSSVKLNERPIPGARVTGHGGPSEWIVRIECDTVGDRDAATQWLTTVVGLMQAIGDMTDDPLTTRRPTLLLRVGYDVAHVVPRRSTGWQSEGSSVWAEVTFVRYTMARYDGKRL